MKSKIKIYFLTLSNSNIKGVGDKKLIQKGLDSKDDTNISQNTPNRVKKRKEGVDFCGERVPF